MLLFDSSQVSFLRGDLADSLAYFHFGLEQKKNLDLTIFDLCHIIFSCGHFHDVDIS